jgi:LuxR family transcriptional activator of bioluminescence operon
MNSHDTAWMKRVMTSTSLANLKATIEKVAEELGFQYFVYRGRFPHLRTGPHEICYDNCPRGWREYYETHGIGTEADPLHNRALQEVTPILWREVVPRHFALLEKAREFGLATGVIHPVHGPGGQWTSLSFIKANGGVAAERGIMSAMAECQLLASYVHDATARIIRRRLDVTIPIQQPTSPELGLSQRERECLTLAAAGMTAAEIARKLCISERTAVFHMANIRRKLGTHSSQHAVMKAISMGLIAAVA